MTELGTQQQRSRVFFKHSVYTTDCLQTRRRMKTLGLQENGCNWRNHITLIKPVAEKQIHILLFAVSRFYIATQNRVCTYGMKVEAKTT